MSVVGERPLRPFCSVTGAHASFHACQHFITRTFLKISCHACVEVNLIILGERKLSMIGDPEVEGQLFWTFFPACGSLFKPKLY